MKIILSILSILFLSNCSENQRAKKFGGVMTINLPPNTKFVSATWKESELWYIYRSRKSGESPETTIMREDSSFGLVEGTVRFIEH